MEKLIRVEHINKYFGSFKAIDDISFELDGGKIYGTIDTIGSESLTRTSAQPENYHDGTCQCPYREHPCLQPCGTFPDDEQEKPESAEIKRSTGIGVIIKPI